MSAVELARKLLADFGGLRALLEADHKTFCQQHGLGTAQICADAGVAGDEPTPSGIDANSGECVYRCSNHPTVSASSVTPFGHEVFACLILDTRHRLISFEPLFRGKIDGASVYPREVVKQALKHNAAAVIFAHNHPSGVAEPSQSEIQLTRQLPRALELVDIRVLDHIIIGDGDTTSLAEMGHC